MKYWNKTRKYRELSWVSVRIEYDHHNSWWEEMKIWCQRHPSKYRFYSGTYTRSNWYFEDSEDALVFKLRWGTRANHER
jgi:hypothetical protein